MICGIDEVGRGCLAGDVVACAVVFHSDPPEGLRDSKKLSDKARRRLDAEIRASAHVGMGSASVREIETINILQATMLAMVRAHAALPLHLRIDEILVDGNRCPDVPGQVPMRAVIGGDGSEIAISAASICAKVERDDMMALLHLDHPEYDWISNQGYGSPRHLAAIAQHGPCIHHRMTFAPLRQPKLDL